MTEPYTPKIVHMPGTKLSPDVVLHRTLDKIGHIKAVVVIIQWNDESMVADWSSMKNSELCMASMVLDETARRTVITKEAET